MDGLEASRPPLSLVLMDTFKALKERRIFQIVASYAAAGWIFLEVVSQLVERDLFPPIVYNVALTWYLAGFLASLVIGWNHGEKGHQVAPTSELWAISILLLGTALFSVRMVTRSLAGPDPTVAGAFDLNRIAVLYLQDVSPDDDLGFLADGLTEAVIAQLSTVRTLDVVSRNGVAPFRGAALPADSIARVLDAGTLVAGTVERSGDDVRVGLRLIDGESGADIERASLSLPMEQIVSLEDSVARELSRSLRSWLGQEVVLRERRAAAPDVRAWSALQRSEHARKDAESLLGEDRRAEAQGAFDRAEALARDAAAMDPSWVEPIVQQGELAYRRARLSAGDREEAAQSITTGLGLADQAIGMDPNNAAALELRGTLNYFAWLLGLDHEADRGDARLQSARTDLEASVDLDPTRASAHSTLSHLYYNTDDVASAVLAARQAYEEDAYLNVADVILYRLYNGSYDLAQFSQARRWCAEGARRFRDDYRFIDCQLWLMLSDGTDADVATAWQLRERLLALVPEARRPFHENLTLLVVGGVIAKSQLPDSANAVMARARLDRDADPEQELVGYEAAIRAVTGDPERAMALLKQYIAAHPGHSFQVGGDLHWWWRSLAADPEFRAVIGRS